MNNIYKQYGKELSKMVSNVEFNPFSPDTRVHTGSHIVETYKKNSFLVR